MVRLCVLAGALWQAMQPLTRNRTALTPHACVLCVLLCCMHAPAPSATTAATARFMQGLRNRDIFRFCAIPQIMSIGTLAQLYNNGSVFEGGWKALADTCSLRQLQ